MKVKSKKIIQAFKLNPKIVDLISKYAIKNETSKTQIVELALIDFFKSKNEDIF